MSRNAEGFSKEVVARAKRTIHGSRAVYLKRAFCILLSTELGLSVKEISDAFGIGGVTVIRYRSDGRAGIVAEDRPKRGGRRPGLMSYEEEEEFLAKTLKAGKLHNTTMLCQRLEAFLGSAITTATAYNMLMRHNWRKVKPPRESKLGSDGKWREVYNKSLIGYWVPPEGDK